MLFLRHSVYLSLCFLQLLHRLGSRSVESWICWCTSDTVWSEGWFAG